MDADHAQPRRRRNDLRDALRTERLLRRGRPGRRRDPVDRADRGRRGLDVGHVASAPKNLLGNLRGISCPPRRSASRSTSAAASGRRTEPAAGAGSWTPTKIPKAKSLFGIDCQTTTECVLVGSGGLILTSTNPTGGAAAWTRTVLPDAPPLRAVTCTGALCVASAFNGEIWTTRPPTGGAAAWTSIGQPPAKRRCSASAARTKRSARRRRRQGLVSTAPTAGAAAWPTTPLRNRFQIVATDCPQPTLCVLASNNGEVTATTNPTGGSGAWLTEHLIKGVTNALFGLSCPTEPLCVAAGKFGQLLTTTQPAATGLPEPPPPPAAADQRPPPRAGEVDPPRRPHPGADGLLPLLRQRIGPFWFRCKLDSNPAGICTDPRQLRVGVGKHVFRVRAFGPGGGATDPLVYRFKDRQGERNRSRSPNRSRGSSLTPRSRSAPAGSGR